MRQLSHIPTDVYSSYNVRNNCGHRCIHYMVNIMAVITPHIPMMSRSK